MPEAFIILAESADKLGVVRIVARAESADNWLIKPVATFIEVPEISVIIAESAVIFVAVN